MTDLIDSHLLAFLAGVVVGGVGLFIAILFDFGMDKLESLCAKSKSGE